MNDNFFARAAKALNVANVLAADGCKIATAKISDMERPSVAIDPASFRRLFAGQQVVREVLPSGIWLWIWYLDVRVEAFEKLGMPATERFTLPVPENHSPALAAEGHA